LLETPVYLEVLIMQKSNSGDNQQETVSETEMGWLAGIIDGEGCIHIDIDPKGGAHPYLTITNTDSKITDKASDIWHRLGIGCRTSTRSNRGKGWNDAIDVMVIGYKRLKPALIAIMPYLVGKADEALLLYEFVESRLEKSLHTYNMRYSQEEMDLIHALKNKKSRNRILRDYTLDHRDVEDIVRTAQRCVEAARNGQPRLMDE